MSGIFLAHIHEDKPKVRKLRDRLRAEGFRTWMDEDNILAGQDWVVGKINIPEMQAEPTPIGSCPRIWRHYTLPVWGNYRLVSRGMP